MPCYTPTSDDEERAKERNKAYQLRAMLCGVLTSLEKLGKTKMDVVLSNVDWEEVGVSRKTAMKYWENHKKEDATRRAQELEDKMRQAKRKKALSKLSLEERKLLGVK